MARFASGLRTFKRRYFAFPCAWAPKGRAEAPMAAVVAAAAFRNVRRDMVDESNFGCMVKPCLWLLILDKAERIKLNG
jgi:hypothetical protein